MSSLILVRFAAPSREIAKTIIEELVTRHLAAGGCVTAATESTYWWQGEIHHELEWLCELYTREPLKDRVSEVITDLHPYEVPGIVFQGFQSGTAEFETWLQQYATGEESPS
uniref:Divalent cation tolerance protein n=1 Tax=Candidatus Kentrum sp. LFY TaxID=2126342 RepID=A0A450WJ09_9GAMM|nr:MAG: divalent cation tolerance protein [Candidatus Kentron sp. LFY]